MKKALLIVLSALVANTASAGEILNQAREAGVNETLTIRYLGKTWGYTYEMTGFSMGTATVHLVPVTRESAAVLRTLNKKSQYSCLIQDSTVVGDTYYVRDLNCD